MRRDRDAYYSFGGFVDGLVATVPELAFVNPSILEPCCGNGSLVRPMRGRGWDVETGDINPSVGADNAWEFVSAVSSNEVGRYDAVITNPPYKHAEAFVRASLEVAPVVAMLLRMTWLEPCVSRRDLLRSLAFVCPFHPRPSFTRDGGCDSVTSAWFVWDRRQDGETIVRFITDWKKVARGNANARNPWRKS